MGITKPVKKESKKESTPRNTKTTKKPPKTHAQKPSLTKEQKKRTSQNPGKRN
jgi:hypothetical protein